MYRPLKFSAGAVFAIAVLSLSLSMDAEPASSPPNKIPVNTAMGKGTVTFSWPLQPGRWGLYESQSPAGGKWSLIAEELHHTNSATVSVSLPLPAKTTYYVVKRAFRVPSLPPNMILPPIPATHPAPHP